MDIVQRTSPALKNSTTTILNTTPRIQTLTQTHFWYAEWRTAEITQKAWNTECTELCTNKLGMKRFDSLSPETTWGAFGWADASLEFIYPILKTGNNSVSSVPRCISHCKKMPEKLNVFRLPGFAQISLRKRHRLHLISCCSVRVLRSKPPAHITFSGLKWHNDPDPKLTFLFSKNYFNSLISDASCLKISIRRGVHEQCLALLDRLHESDDLLSTLDIIIIIIIFSYITW